MAGEVRRERVDPVERGGGAIASWLRCQVRVGFPLRVVTVASIRPVTLRRGSGRSSLDLVAGLVVAAAESVADALERVLGLRQRAFAGVGDLGRLLGGVDVRDAQRQRRRVSLGGDLPVAQRALVAVRSSAGRFASRSARVADRAQRVVADVGEEPFAEARCWRAAARRSARRRGRSRAASWVAPSRSRTRSTGPARRVASSRSSAAPTNVSSAALPGSGRL